MILCIGSISGKRPSSRRRYGDQNSAYVPISHPFVERLIGTIRREYLDRTLFWTAVDLESKLSEFKDYYNRHCTHASLAGKTPEESPGVNVCLTLKSYRWKEHCHGLFQTPTAA